MVGTEPEPSGGNEGSIPGIGTPPGQRLCRRLCLVCLGMREQLGVVRRVHTGEETQVEDTEDSGALTSR